MSTLELNYALPLSRLSIESDVTVTNDSVLDEEKSTPLTTVSLEVGAASRDQTLEATTSFFRDTAIQLDLTDDGRLTSTALESTGELGKVVVGVVGFGVAAVGAAAHLMMMEGRPKAATDKVEDEFAKANPDVARLRSGYIDLIAETTGQIAEIATQLPNADASMKRKLIDRLGYLEGLLPVLRGELEKLNETFRAWRATTVVTRHESHQLFIDLDEAQTKGVTVTGGQVDLSNASRAARTAWNDLGVAIVVESPCSPPTNPVSAAKRKDAVLVRIPRQTTVSIYGKASDGRAVLRERKIHLVMDSCCETREIGLRKSLWTKRSVTLGFDELGALTSFKRQSDSAAAAAATTLGSLPATVADSLEAAGKIRSGLASLRAGGVEEELSRVKTEVELKQQELARAGLAATQKDHDELERLKQRAEILEQRKKIHEDTAIPVTDPAGTEISDLKQQVELTRLQLELQKLKAGTMPAPPADG
jgi:hypothetical protein